MKKSATIFATVLLSSAVLIAPAFAAVDVGDAMKEMSKSYRLVMKDSDAAGLKKDLATLKAAAIKAQSGVPGNIKDKSEGSDERKTFAEGMQKFIDQVDVTSKLVDEGKVPEAKAEAAKLKDLMKVYHSKLGV